MPQLPRRPTPGSLPPGQRPRTPGGGPDRPPTPAGRRNRLVRNSKRIVWYGSEKPSKRLAKKYKVGKAGSGPLKGYYVALRKPTKPKPNPTTPAPAAPAAPPAPAAPDAPAAPSYTGPYADMPEWARNIMLGYDTQAQQHQQYVTGQVLPWLSGALQGINQFNESAQNQLQNFYNAGAGAQQVSAQAGTPNVAPVAPGAGPIQGDMAYLVNAAKQAAGASGSVAQQLGQYRTAMGKLAPTNQSGAVISAMGQFAAGLPAAYSQRRNERMLEIRNYIERQRQFDETQARLKSQFDQDMQLAQARFQEDTRRYGIEFAYRQFNDARSAAISQLNANNGLILGLGSLGLRGTELAAELGQQPPTAPSSVPPGFTVIPTDDGGYEVVRDPTVPAAGSGQQVDTRPFKQGTREWFVQNGYKPLPANAPAKTRQTLQRQGRLSKSVDGSGFWVKVGSGSGSGGGGTEPPEDAIVKLNAYYGSAVTEGETPPARAANLVSSWLYNNRGLQFEGQRLTGKNKQVNRSAILGLLTKGIGGPKYKNTAYSQIAVATWETLLRTRVVKRNGKYFWK